MRAWKHTFCFLALVCLGLVESECIKYLPFYCWLEAALLLGYWAVSTVTLGFASVACALQRWSAPSTPAEVWACLRSVTLAWLPQEQSHCRMCQTHTSAAFIGTELKPFRGELSLILLHELLTPGIWWKLIQVSLWLTVGCLANPTHDYFQRQLLHCRIS